MQSTESAGDLFLSVFLQNPVMFIAALVVLFFLLKGKTWHAMYVYILVTGAYVVSEAVGFTQFIGGVIVGVIGNELFTFVRSRLKKEQVEN